MLLRSKHRGAMLVHLVIFRKHIWATCDTLLIRVYLEWVILEKGWSHPSLLNPTKERERERKRERKK